MVNHKILSTLNTPGIWLIITLTIISYISIYMNHSFVHLLQIIMLLFASSLTIIEQYNTIYGTSIWVLAYMLTYRYGFLKSQKKIKNILFIVFLLIFVETSAFLSDNSGYGIETLIFLSLFIILIYTINKSEIDRVLISEKNMQTSIHLLIQERIRLKKLIEEDKNRLKKLEEKIQTLQIDNKPFDLKECRLTPAEMRIVEALVRTRASNKEISDLLGIKENTVKQHLYKVFNKMGVDDRFQIIDLCKYNFE